VKAHGVKVLVGTPVTCDKAADETAWGWTKELLTALGPDHVMGLAVGNELELLYTHESSGCITELWGGGRLWETFTNHFDEFDRMGFAAVPVTSVFTAAVLGGNPFMEDASKGLVNTFLKQASTKYQTRFVFSFNIYPYFDPNLKMNPGSTTDCSIALHQATCWDSTTCLGPAIMVSARNKMQQLTARPNDLFWVGEIGWSSPMASALGTVMDKCEAFSSLEAFQSFYKGFLEWDFNLAGTSPPDHVFYFTLRDALNFGKQEHFGLIDSCTSLACKIASPGFKASECTVTPPGGAGGGANDPMPWRTYVYAALGIALVLGLGGVCVWVRLSKKVVDPRKPTRMQRLESDESSSSE